MHHDFFELCVVRFDKWFKCDRTFDGLRQKFSQNNERYPCFKHFYEMQYACSDHFLNYLMELHYYRTVNNLDPEKLTNIDITSVPTLYDSNAGINRIRHTY